MVGYGDLAAGLDAVWAARWPHLRPFGDELRFDKERWVRFHSLPESKRYADTEEEWAILLGRQHAILDDLGAPPELVAITPEWTVNDAFPNGREIRLEAAAPATYWRTLVQDEVEDEDDDVIYTHLYVGMISRQPAAIDPLLRLIAYDQTAGVILAPPDLEWLVHPYDGGTDVIAATSFERDALRERRGDWLPDNPQGL